MTKYFGIKIGNKLKFNRHTEIIKVKTIACTHVWKRKKNT